MCVKEREGDLESASLCMCDVYMYASVCTCVGVRMHA